MILGTVQCIYLTHIKWPISILIVFFASVEEQEVPIETICSIDEVACRLDLSDQRSP
jgi:hypothetical protein